MPFSPLYMTQSVLKLGATDYAAEISGARLVPTSSSATWKGLKAGSTFTKAGLATWALTLDLGQDHETATSLSTYLFANEGSSIAFTLEPLGGGTAFAGTIIVQASEIGGAVDQFGTATVSLPVSGKPVRTPKP